MPKRPYVVALVCYLAIPVVVIGGAVVFSLIDPEMARGHANYARNFQLLQMAARGAAMAAAGFALIVAASTCYLVLRSRQRSWLWLLLGAAGPFGLMFITMLEDRAPAPGDLYQGFIGRLKMYWRVPLEIALFFAFWFLAFALVALKSELMITYESYSTGTPVATIVAVQNASSGMWAFSEALEATYLVMLIYLLWPVLFNLVGPWFTRRTPAGELRRQA